MERRTQATTLHGQSDHLQQSWNPMYSRQQPQSYDANNDLSLEKLTCNICGYKAKAVSLFQIHFRKHTGEKPFHCPHCNFSSAQSNNLKSHIRRVHLPPELKNTSLSAVPGTYFPGYDERIGDENVVSESPPSQRSINTLEQSTQLNNSSKSYSATDGKLVPKTPAMFNNPSSIIASSTSLPSISEGSIFKGSSSIDTSASGSEHFWRETLHPHVITADTSNRTKSLHPESVNIPESRPLLGSTKTFQSQRSQEEMPIFTVDPVNVQTQSSERGENFY